MVCLFKQRPWPFFVIVAFLYILFLSAGRGAAADVLPQNPEEISWHISARTVTFHPKKNLYIAEGDVVITGGETRLEADYVEFSNKTKDAFAQGNVLLLAGKDSISCNAMNINLATQIGTINKGTIFIQKNNFYIDGENIRKTGQFTYSAQKGSITSCAGDSPDWKISGKNLNITIEGYGTVNHAVLWAKKVPVIYSPFLVFPVQTKRQTGLLAPRTTSSDRKGFEYEQPLFIAISENTDATVYADYMSDRGTKLAAEYRYVLDNTSKGSVFFDFLDDDKIDDGTDETKNYSFDSTPQRTNTDRFWFRMKNNQDLPRGFTAKLDIDIASDEDYLLEFRDGFTGYDETDLYFEREFGRNLDEYDDNTRKNWLNINKTWSNSIFDFEAVWYDNIHARRQDIDDTTLQLLPGIQFDIAGQQIGTSQFFYTLDTEYRSFYRQDTTDTLVRGQRVDIHPRVYLPMKFGSYFNFEPSVGVRETVWYTDDFTDINGNSDSIRTRQMFDLGAILSTKFIKIYTPEIEIVDKIKHELIPKLEYNFIPNVTQDDLPTFGPLDNIEEENLLTWSLTNYFISKKSSAAPEGKDLIAYHEFTYIKLYQSYDIRKEKDNEPRPFSDIALDVEIYLNKFFSLDLDLTWSPYDNQFNTFNIHNTIRDNRGDSLTAEYRYTIDESETLYSKINISLTDEISAYYSIEENLDINRTVETTAGFALKKSCWTFNFYFSESRNKQSFTFLINLHGIGEIGTR